MEMLYGQSKMKDYEQMITTVVGFNRSHGSKDKNVEYIAKLLAAIQKMRQSVLPDQEEAAPMSPFQAIEKVEKRIKQLQSSVKKTGRQGRNGSLFKGRHYFTEIEKIL